jgi:hypothetical protein
MNNTLYNANGDCVTCDLNQVKTMKDLGYIYNSPPNTIAPKNTKQVAKEEEGGEEPEAKKIVEDKDIENISIEEIKSMKLEKRKPNKVKDIILD